MGKVSEEEAMQEPSSCVEESIQGSSGSEERIFVSVRLRPLNGKEITRNDVSDWECINENTIIYRNNLSVSERSMYPTAYTFDRVFSPDCTTRKVYEEGAKEVALSVVSGINSSIFAYGQTSSGKTYTMSGITEYAMSDIYDYVEKHKDREFILKFSALEIYNESVRDLLSTDSSPLRLLDDPERGTIVEKLTEETLRDWGHFKELLSICEAQRQIGETSLNEASSRSHQILRVTVESSAREFLRKEKSSSLTATVNFVDLAGSERASQALSAGTRLKEGCHINRSLLTLGTVVRKLSKGRNGHIPYRDSKLTRILQSSLGGNARTAIICTLSPAQSHVEQSRNTLVFASCAKEVTTNAQVNIVMSDKALVKQLQRQLARLENELRSAGANSSVPDSAVSLREKDTEIEKLKKEVRELTLQRDLAESQVEYLLREVVDDRPSMVVMDPQYPKLRVRNSSDNLFLKSETPESQKAHCLDISVKSSNTSRFSDRQSNSSDENIFQIFDLEEKSSRTNTPQHNKYSFSNAVGSERSLQETETQDETVEDNCRDVRCIETEESTNGYADSNTVESCPAYQLSNNAGVSPVSSKSTDAEHKDEQNQDMSSTPLNDQKVWKTIDPDVVTPSPAKPSPEMLDKDVSSPASLKLTRSSSCKASFATSLSSRLFENDENYSIPSLSSEKDQIVRSEGVKRKFTALKLAVEVEKLTRNGSHSSGGNEKQPSDDVDTERKPVACAKSVRDIGLDPIQLDLGSPLNWPFEFKRLQREIIQLWNACNVSLVHRTYFFLLFKGDPKDSIYMEVEHRRLSLIKDTFAWDNQSAEGSPTMTTDSSMKKLREERQMLSSQMKKKFSEEERKNLFLRWGIGLQTKQRRLQLANLLWRSTEDMNHIIESATVVSKLVGLVKPEQAIKEMFGVKFTPKRASKIANLWKKNFNFS